MNNQRGQSMAEALIVLPIALMLIAATFEMTLMYRAKSTISVAAQDVATTGTTSSISKNSMDVQLVRSILPLIPEDNLFIKVSKAKNFVMGGGAKFKVISPTKEIFQAFKKTVYDLDTGKKISVIPNDNLMFRDSKPKKVKIDGENRNINIQDANLLKLEVSYCHRLVVPVLDRVITSIFTTPALCLPFTSTGNRYVLITGNAVARMQSPVFKEILRK
jgi:hypothetical protein